MALQTAPKRRKLEYKQADMATLLEHSPQHFAKYTEDSDNLVPSRLICMVCTAAEDKLHGLQLESVAGTYVLEAHCMCGKHQVPAMQQGIPPFVNLQRARSTKYIGIFTVPSRLLPQKGLGSFGFKHIGTTLHNASSVHSQLVVLQDVMSIAGSASESSVWPRSSQQGAASQTSCGSGLSLLSQDVFS